MSRAHMDNTDNLHVVCVQDAGDWPMFFLHSTASEFRGKLIIYLGWKIPISISYIYDNEVFEIGTSQSKVKPISVPLQLLNCNVELQLLG